MHSLINHYASTTSFVIHHSSSFMIIHIRIFSFILFWSTPSCFSFGPHCRLEICSEVSNNLSPRGLHISVVDKSMISPGSKPQHSSTLKKLRQPQHSRKKKNLEVFKRRTVGQKTWPKRCVYVRKSMYVHMYTLYVCIYIYICYSRMSYYIISRI